MAIKSRTIAVIGATITGGGLIALLLSFASDRWLVASNFAETGFSNLGLWSVCFDGKYRPPPFAAVSREYEGCWWALNKELDDLKSFLFPKWFVSTQVLVTISLVLVLIVAILLVVNFINCFPYSAHKEAIKRGIALTCGLLLCITGILLGVAVILFGVKATSTRTWLQNSDNNYLSWSYGMCILADFLFFIGAMCLFLQFLRLRGEKEDPDNSEPKVFLTNEPPPATNYRYTPGRNTVISESRATQPAYVQRYEKAPNSRQNPRGPDSLFAVSGAGEVYVNRMADYEEKQNDEYRDGYRERGRNGKPPWREPKIDTKPNTDQLDTSIDGTYIGSDYEKSKMIKHAALPEYTPKSARKAKEAALEDVSDSDTLYTLNKDEKKKKRENKGEKKGERKSRSNSKKKRNKSRDRSRSGSRSRKKNFSDSEYSDSESTKKRSKHRSRSRDDSEDGRSRRRSKKRSSSGGSKKRRKSRSRSRDRSRDDYTTYSDSQLDSDSGSVESRSRRRYGKDKHSSREDLSRRDKKKRSSSRKKKNRDGNISDDKSGSEYSHRRSRRKNGRESEGESKRRMRDFSETESVRSNRSRSKPKGTYSSYYE